MSGINFEVEREEEEGKKWSLTPNQRRF